MYTVLTTVRSILDSPFISFGQFYQNYVMNIQDNMIDNELASLYRNNSLSPINIIRLINNELGSL